jgi:hypothetical protein
MAAFMIGAACRLNGNSMTKMRRKADLPVKTCVTCGRPFAWRKKWARDWEQVKYCSHKCRQSSTKDLTLSDRKHP